jgi:hypothetical protein
MLAAAMLSNLLLYHDKVDEEDLMISGLRDHERDEEDQGDEGDESSEDLEESVEDAEQIPLKISPSHHSVLSVCDLLSF